MEPGTADIKSMEVPLMPYHATTDGNWAGEIPPSILVSAVYDPGPSKIILKLYDPRTGSIRLWADETDSKPYCYSKLSRSDLDELAGVYVEEKELADPVTDEKIPLLRLVANEPKTISDPLEGLVAKMETWEGDIKFHESYLYDRGFIVGSYYKTEYGKLVPAETEIPSNVRAALKTMLLDKADTLGMVDEKKYKEYISEWAELLNQPIPKIRRLAVDIEIESDGKNMPDAGTADRKITAIGLYGSGDYSRVMVLDDGTEHGEKQNGPEPEFFKSEKEMLLAAFSVMEKFPFILTYNGDDFDLPYMLHRATRVGIKDGTHLLRGVGTTAHLRRGVHIDLYRTFSNRAFQIYAFGQKYTEFSLGAVSQALLGRTKIDYGKPLNELTLRENAHYCLYDAKLTYDLSAFDSDLLMNLLIMVCRIGKISIDSASRTGVSQWIRSLMYYEHRRGGYLIPRRDELEKRSEGVISDSVIKDKKYRGGLVVEPVEGVHFGVVVMDFASLYPSIIKVRNLSYETVRCSHESCKSNKIPQTNHWSCSKKNGMASQLIGSLRDLRVNYYKQLSRDKGLDENLRGQYETTSQALKVILNASYGVMGADIFPLYFLPAAEATTAVGRHTIVETIETCKQGSIQVLYGDTDSIFVLNPTEKQMQGLITGAKEKHGVELEVDKKYRYCVLSNRKKNYLGVSETGKVDVKGLTGKKSHTPKFIKDLFYEIVKILGTVENKDGFKKAQDEIKGLIAQCGNKLSSQQIPLQDLTFNVMLSKAPDEYRKNIPQHIRAAMMIDGGAGFSKGDRISFVKTLNKSGVKPVQIATLADIDIKKYVEFMETVLGQITGPLGIEFDSALGRPKQVGLEQYFWS